MSRSLGIATTTTATNLLTTAGPKKELEEKVGGLDNIIYLFEKLILGGEKGLFIVLYNVIV
jgi:hypothetical protein